MPDFTRTLVSVVMPVYQGMPYLRNAVESVLAQSLHRFEVLIGEDGSTDGGAEYLAGLRDPRVRYFSNASRRGLFRNLNQLLGHCKAPFIRVLCQDDVLERNCLQRETQFLSQHPEAAFTIAKFRAIDSAGRTVYVTQTNDLPDILPSPLAVQHFFYHGCIAGNLSTVCFRESALAGAGFDESYAFSGDYELWSRLASKNAIGILHDHLVQIRRHGNQLSKARHSHVPFVMENARIRSELKRFLPEQVRGKALEFEYRRHHVLDFHLSLRCLFQGRLKDTVQIWKVLGPRAVRRALVHWIWTFNNRLVRPQAPWVLPAALP